MKKYGIFALTLALAMSMAACGCQKQPEPTAPTVNTTVPTTLPETVPTVPETDPTLATNIPDPNVDDSTMPTLDTEMNGADTTEDTGIGNESDQNPETDPDSRMRRGQ